MSLPYAIAAPISFGIFLTVLWFGLETANKMQWHYESYRMGVAATIIGLIVGIAFFVLST